MHAGKFQITKRQIPNKFQKQNSKFQMPVIILASDFFLNLGNCVLGFFTKGQYTKKQEAMSTRDVSKNTRDVTFFLLQVILS
jgi:hypothetical protein